MKYGIMKRILSLVLCISMLIPMLTQSKPVYSVVADSRGPINLEVNIGKQAIFDWWTDFLLIDQDTLMNSTAAEMSDYYGNSEVGYENWVLYDDIPANDLVLKITDYHYDEENGFHWYKVTGDDLPEILQEKPWILYSDDIGLEDGYDPYLVIYNENDVIRIINVSVNNLTNVRFVLSGPDALADATISITDHNDDYSVSSLAFVHEENGSWSNALKVEITKANGAPWTSVDGNVGILYTAEQIATDTYNEDVLYGAAFLYVDEVVFSAAVTDKMGYDVSDIVYTNSASSVIVFEFLLESFDWLAETAYFTGESVTLYDNQFGAKDYLAAQLPAEFKAGYSFTYNDEIYYWLESEGFIGSPYFIVKASDVTLGELPEEYGDGRVTVTDENGNAVSAITLPIYEKLEFTAVSSLSQLTAGVNYQWEIEYEDGKWVDIYGEDVAAINISYGMVAALFNDEGVVNIRCKSQAGNQIAYSKAIPLTLVASEPNDPEFEISKDITTSEGENVAVTVSGNIPEDAELNLEDASGTEVNGVESFEIALALDVKIKQNDSEWQPAEGETVTVSILAAQLGLEDGDFFTVYHLHNGKTELLGPFVVADGYATFEIDGFSVVVISTNYGAALGATAEISHDLLMLYPEPMSLNATMAFKTNLPEKLIITDYYFDAGNARLLYKIDAAPGYVWPEDFAHAHWCESTDLIGINVDGTAGVFDSNGDPVVNTSVTTSAGVVVSAITSLQSADITYKWQICYDTENDLWVNISGENDAEITIVAGMIISLKDENDQVKVRCVTSAGSKTVITEPIIITLLEPKPSDDTVDVLVDGEVAENMNISASDLQSFNSALSANTTLTGDLTYSWEVLFDKTYDMWWLQGQSATFKPVFDPYKDGTYLDSNFIHAVDATTSEIYIRLTVSDGTNMVRNTFVITVNNEVSAVASYRSRPRNVVALADASDGTTGSGDTTIYKIEINYLYYHNMQIAAPAYTSSVGSTTQLTDPVVFPTVMGYLPYVMNENGTFVRMDEWKFEGYLTEDFELNVFYQPTNVSYTVNIYTQNAEDDNYQLLMTRTMYALTGTVIDAISMPIPGYYQTKMTTTTASVAADGSTVFNLYYDRIYYLMKFDLDGGYGVQPIFARHGVKLDIPSPTKAGYTFVGWDDITSGSGDGIADTLPDTMPVNGKTYKAIWKAAENAKVTIVYWGENPNDDGYSYKESVEIYAKVGSTLTFGTNQMVCTLDEHTHNAGCTTTCNQEGHTHTDTCYGNCTHKHSAQCYAVRVGNNDATLTEVTNTNTINTLNSSEKWDNGVVRTGGRLSGYHYYKEIDGTWYELSRSVNSGTDINVTTSNCEHTHIDSCVDCSLHVHNASCYPSCIAHTHSSSCRLNTPTGDEYDSALWTLNTDPEKNKSVTVAADGTTVMNVFYDRVEYAVEFHNNQSCTNEYTTLRITAKWGASILSKWPTYNESSSWLVQNKNNTWQNSIQIMPVGGAKFWGPKTGNSSYKAYYYTEALPGDTNTIVYNGVTYVLHHTDVSSSSGNVTDEERYGIEGFTYKEGTANGNSYNNAKFYYLRNQYILEFNNGETIEKTASVKYLYNLGSYAFTPTPPSYYEAGSVQFAGWYQNPECTGEEVVLSNTTMPSSNKLLYAKWVPVEHDVTIYRYKNADGSFPTGNDIIQETIKLPHGSFLQQQYIPEDPENTPYTFVGWFYMDGNTEKAFDFKNMPVTKDLQIYAKWSSNVQLPYTIKYVLKGTNTEIAERETGKQFAGETMTFHAKTGDALNPGYQSGYFPTVPSHSIEFNLKDNLPSYEYVFEYVYKDAVPYTVYYLAETLNDGATSYGTIEYGGKTYYKIVSDKTVNSRDAIVTENFVQVQGYMPNAYQQSLVLSGADDAVNEIYFFYTVDTVHAYYKVSHYTQNLDGSWYEYSTYESVGTIGSIYTETPRTINGFTYNPGIADTLTTGELTAEGLHLKLFYTRNRYPYKVEYRIEGSGVLLETDAFITEDSMKYYSESISVSPNHTFSGYHLVSNSPVNHIIQIEQDANMQNPVANVIIFYYAEDQVTINYVVKGPAGCGTVTPTSQTVNVINGRPLSAADATSAAYKFVGWYKDEACTQFVTESRVIEPKQVNGLHVAATYYAKFEYNLTSLKIQKQGHDPIDENQTFLFRITDEEGLELTVTVHGNGSVTIDGLTVGKKYKIVEITGWSWRYTNNGVVKNETTVVITDDTIADGAEFTLNPTGNVIMFTNERSNPYWLDGDSWCNNIFKSN
ncbi:MAG: InlB B-repeat-containing protein [Clostridia bacterium]|nr:InlB B-repeat-containing protein [Clostridia bacterium]